MHLHPDELPKGRLIVAISTTRSSSMGYCTIPMTAPAAASGASTAIGENYDQPSPAQLQMGTALMANVRHMVDFVSTHPERAGSRSPMIKRVDLGDNGVSYHAMVGPRLKRPSSSAAI